MSHPLDGVQAKLDRAFEHGQALREEVRLFLESEPYDVPDERRADPKVPNALRMTGHLRVLREPPTKLGLLAGDFAHNARGALDHLVYQLALLGGKGHAPTGTYFPIARTEDEYRCPGPNGQASLRDRALAGVLDEHRALIDPEQPYNAGSRQDADRHPLAVLNAFWNRDKHRLVHVAALRPWRIEAFPVQGSCDVEIVFPKPLQGPETLADGAKVYDLRLTKPSDDQVRVQVNFVFSIGFGPDLLDDANLLNIQQYVSRIVDKFRPIFA